MIRTLVGVEITALVALPGPIANVNIFIGLPR